MLSHWSHDTIKDFGPDLFSLFKWEEPASLRCELNLLGRPYGVGWVVKDVQTRPLIGVRPLISRT